MNAEYFSLAPGAGLEPATYALTAHRSTIELPGIIVFICPCRPSVCERLLGFLVSRVLFKKKN